MDRQWINIKGRKLLCTEFIYILDRYRCCSLLRKCGERIYEQYCHMIYVLQELTSDYMEGENYVRNQLADFFKNNYMDMPTERKLPEALEEIFRQLESKLDIDFTEMLEQCVLRTKEEYLRIQELNTKEEKRILLIKSLMEESKIDKSNDKEPENKVKNLLLLQKAKIKSDLYEMDEKEIHITKLWCDLLISSIFSEVISYGQMLRLVENDVVTESELTELLKDKYNIEKDYEWYAEDFIGCGLEEDTDIKIEDIWQLYTKRMEKIIGIPL